MALRLMQIVLPEAPDDALSRLWAEQDVVLPPCRMGDVWQAQIIVPAESAEILTDPATLCRTFRIPGDPPSHRGRRSPLAGG